MNHQLPISKLLTARETIIIFSVWLTITALIFIYPWSEFFNAWAFIIPFGWIFYQVTLRYIFPRVLATRFPVLLYIIWDFLFCIISFFLIVIMMSMAIEDEGFIFSIAGFYFFTLFLGLAPIQWFVFKRLARSNEELFAIKKELGQTEANVDMLRSQINPHFLFNALNTLYGLAIQEKADRTSEAIEKLGGMMRFMLQENMQEKISLSRDLEYLNNYIALQRLRTDINPNIKIQIVLQQEVDAAVMIAPMLLIPFIENAFKHGISLREESIIRVSLELKESTLYFDVFNTKHARSENDPEKNSNGIGLVNVKQRLKLVYPGKHELVIRETAHDYFVHLVITLV